MQLRLEDLQIDVFRAGVNSPQRVRVIHRPTGKSGQAEDRSYLRAREAALAALETKLSH